MVAGDRDAISFLTNKEIVEDFPLPSVFKTRVEVFYSTLKKGAVRTEKL